MGGYCNHGEIPDICALCELEKRKDWLPVSEGSPCHTTHFACDCQIKRMKELEAENERLRRFIKTWMVLDD